MRLTLLFLFAILFVSSRGFSQINGNYNYSIAARGFSVTELPKIFNQSSPKYISTGLTGGMLKFNDNQISYRISGNFINKSISFDNTCTNCDFANGKIMDYAFAIGFEKNFNYAHIQPYFAVDIGYRFNHFKGMMSTVNNQRSITASNALEDTKDGATATPTVGIKLNPFKQVTIFAESSMEFYYAYVRQETVLQDASATKTQGRFNRGDFLLNPISIGIQIHLVNKN